VNLEKWHQIKCNRLASAITPERRQVVPSEPRLHRATHERATELRQDCEPSEDARATRTSVRGTDLRFDPFYPFPSPTHAGGSEHKRSVCVCPDPHERIKYLSEGMLFMNHKPICVFYLETDLEQIDHSMCTAREQSEMSCRSCCIDCEPEKCLQPDPWNWHCVRPRLECPYAFNKDVNKWTRKRLVWMLSDRHGIEYEHKDKSTVRYRYLFPPEPPCDWHEAEITTAGQAIAEGFDSAEGYSDDVRGFLDQNGDWFPFFQFYEQAPTDDEK